MQRNRRVKIIAKDKKQFRLYDIYRCATIGVPSLITGIASYSVTNDASKVVILYETGYKETHFARNEADLKEIVHHVNTKLCNCYKPGRKVQSIRGDKIAIYEAEKTKIVETAKSPAEYERRINSLVNRLGI